MCFYSKTKRNLILKKYLHYDHGQLAPYYPPLQFTLTEGDTVYFDFYTDNLSLADSLIYSRCYINNYIYSAGFHSVYPDSMAIYGNLYRGWGQFSYYGNTSTIDESSLIIDQTLIDTTLWENFPFSDIENNMYNWDFDTLD